MASTPSKSSSTSPTVALDIDGLTASMAELRSETLENVSSVPRPAAASPQETSRWMNRTRLGRFPPRKEHAAVAVDNIIYSVGGVNYSDETSYLRDAVDVFVLNVSRRDKTWKRLPIKNSEVKPNQRYGHSAVAHKECVIIFGGYDIKKEKASNSTYILNTKTLKWEQPQVTGIAPLPRSNHSAVVIGHEMYIYGGDNWNEKLTNDLHCFDLNSFCWSTVETKGISPALRYGHSATVYNDRVMLIFGGKDVTWKEEVNTILSFDFNAKTWTRVKTHGTPPESRKDHCAFVHNGLLYIYGGGQNSDDDLSFDDVFSFDPETCEWEEVYPDGNTPPPREGAGCVALHGKVFIFGGYYSYDVFDDVFLDDTHVLRV